MRPNIKLTSQRHPRPQATSGRTWLSRAAWCGAALMLLLAPPGTSGADSGPSLTDPEIAQAIETDLLIDPSVSSHMIDVSVVDGIVTLAGTVDSLLSKQRSVEIAQTIKGVRSVINRLEVRPLKRSDEQIRQDIKAAWLRDPATDSYELQVEVEDGQATLTGQVQSWQEKQLAAHVAKSVKGLKAIDNQITFKWVSNRPDAEVKADIERRLRADVWVDEAFIEVDVDNGRVKLSGAVGSAIEKTYAANNAWVTGVRELDTSNLVVDPALKDPKERVRRQSYQTDDETIKETIEKAFMYDPRVFSFNPKVTVQDGLVTLRGAVDNLQAKRAAERDARNTRGVWRVINRLKVRPLAARSDTAIEEDVRAALRSNPYIEPYEVGVRVINQKVFLSGRVDSSFIKQTADRLAASVNGVVEVQNNIAVDRRESAEAGYPDYLPWGRPYYYSGVVLYDYNNDMLVKQDIRDQLFWSPFVDSEDITVTVEDGEATLRGRVESHLERGAAIDNAYEGGARIVHDKMTLVN